MMAHFARLNENKVSDVIVISNEMVGNLEFPESEVIGQEYIASIGLTGVWKQTSYNENFRGRFAGAGFTYDSELDEFTVPAPDLTE